MNTDQYRGRLLMKDGKPILADELISQKVVVLSDFRPPKEKKVWWWRKMHPLQALQVPVSVVVFIAAVSGIVFTAKTHWHAAATMWALAFWFFFLFWALGLQARKKFDLFKTED